MTCGQFFLPPPGPEQDTPEPSVAIQVPSQLIDTVPPPGQDALQDDNIPLPRILFNSILESFFKFFMVIYMI